MDIKKEQDKYRFRGRLSFFIGGVLVAGIAVWGLDFIESFNLRPELFLLACTVPAGFFIFGVANFMEKNNVPIFRAGEIIEIKYHEKWEQEPSKYKILGIGEGHYLLEDLKFGSRKEVHFAEQSSYKRLDQKQLEASKSSPLKRFINSKVKETV